MLTDPREQHIAAAFKAARPLPRAGWDARALAAMADVRPRRHPNLLTFIIVVALILLLAAGVFATVRYFFVEGRLQFRDTGVSWLSPEESEVDPVLSNVLRVLSGELEWHEGVIPPHIDPFDISSTGDVLFWRDRLAGPAGPGTDILRAKLDGSEEVNLTEIAGIGGINWRAKWSPDESMIVFEHKDPAEGQPNYSGGDDVWVMNADGTGAHRVTPEGAPATCNASWSPDGSRLLMQTFIDEEWQYLAVSSDIWGTDIRPLPNVCLEPAWSPDGSMIVSNEWAETQVDGQAGVRRTLLLASADGSNPRVLVEQSIVYAEVEARYPTDEMLDREPGLDWVHCVILDAGPREPVWSPGSDKIAFLAALPFDPEGLYLWKQVEVWVYDLAADELIRVTDDDIEQNSLSWK